MHKIGDFASLSQIPVKTLRYYDEIGLLRPANVDGATGYRYYGAEQLEQLNRILVLKDLGFSLREIRALVADKVATAELRAVLQHKRERLLRHIELESARLASAAARLELLEGSQGAAHEVAVRNTGARLVASVRDIITTHAESEQLFEELDREVGSDHAGCHRGVIWHACRKRSIDCEALVFLTGHVESKGRVRSYRLPAQRIASLVYHGEDDYPSAYRDIRAWLSATGAQIVGPKREIFLAEARPDAESVTEIQFPIAA